MAGQERKESRRSSSDQEIYLDVETLRLSHEVPGGWSNIKAFGLALAVTWNPEHEFRTWFEESAAALVTELAGYSRVITFNGNRFDLEVLAAYGPIHHVRSKSFDVLADLHARLGHRVSLNDLASGTLGCSKSGSGMDAVRWWREGQTAKVEKYCKQDVQILRDIVTHGREQGYVIVDSRKIKVEWT